jgi:hypothetical protein
LILSVRLTLAVLVICVGVNVQTSLPIPDPITDLLVPLNSRVVGTH